MASVSEARLHYRQLERCVLPAEGAASAAPKHCSEHKERLVRSASDAVARECSAHVEDFFRCYKHGFRLDFCGDEITSNVASCHKRLSNHILTPSAIPGTHDG